MTHEFGILVIVLGTRVNIQFRENTESSIIDDAARDKMRHFREPVYNYHNGVLISLSPWQPCNEIQAHLLPQS